MANVNGRPTLGNAWLSNGAIARNVEDFEQVMDTNDFNALTRMLDEKKAIEDYENEDYRELYRREELNSDELYNQNVAVYNMIVDMKNYIVDAKRMNKAKMIDMLNEMLNQIDNY